LENKDKIEMKEYRVKKCLNVNKELTIDESINSDYAKIKEVEKILFKYNTSIDLLHILKANIKNSSK